MIFSLFWDVTQRRLIVTDVLGQPVGRIFKVRAVQEKTYLTVMGVDWSNLTQDRKVTGCYEEGDELPYTIMREKFCDWLRTYKFLTRECAAPILLVMTICAPMLHPNADVTRINFN